MNKRKRVAIIEDNEETRELLKAVLENQGCEVFAAATGMEIVKHLGTGKPDLILLDLNLPGISGEEVMKIFKEQGLVEGVPVVIISGEKDDTVRSAAENAGIAATIKKPFKVETVLSVIKQYIK